MTISIFVERKVFGLLVNLGSDRHSSSSDCKVVDGFRVARVRELLVADFGLGEAYAADVADRTAHGQEPCLPEPLHGGQVDLPQPQAGTHAPDLLLKQQKR